MMLVQQKKLHIVSKGAWNCLVNYAMPVYLWRSTRLMRVMYRRAMKGSSERIFGYIVMPYWDHVCICW